MDCDVLIIGAGPAGVSLAYFLSQNRVKTILVDRKKNIGDPLRCAEFVPGNLVDLFPFHLGSINNIIDNMDIYAGILKPASSINLDKIPLLCTVASPGFMLDRKKFLEDLLQKFRQNGGIYINSANALDNFSYSGKKVICTIFDKKTNAPFKLKSKIIAGADGPSSIVGRFIGSGHKKFLLAIGENLLLKGHAISHLQFFFFPFLKGGYGWIFPKSGSINIGVGIEGIGIKKLFSIFKSLMMENNFINFKKVIPGPGNFNSNENGLYQKIDEHPGHRITGLIPVSGMVKKPVLGNFILLGDAAGLCHPVTGAGIYNSVYSASLCCPVILKSLNDSDLKPLDGITRIYQEEFGRSLDRALSRRNLLSKTWPAVFNPGEIGPVGNYLENEKSSKRDKKNTSDIFINLVKKTWPAFKEYWKE